MSRRTRRTTKNVETRRLEKSIIYYKQANKDYHKEVLFKTKDIKNMFLEGKLLKEASKNKSFRFQGTKVRKQNLKKKPNNQYQNLKLFKRRKKKNTNEIAFQNFSQLLKSIKKIVDFFKSDTKF